MMRSRVCSSRSSAMMRTMEEGDVGVAAQEDVIRVVMRKSSDEKKMTPVVQDVSNIVLEYNSYTSQYQLLANKENTCYSI
jgi:hypothetical protein